MSLVSDQLFWEAATRSLLAILHMINQELFDLIILFLRIASGSRLLVKLFVLHFGSICETGFEWEGGVILR